MSARIRIWLQLLRAPNLFTVGGDPLAGFMLANFGIPTPEVFWAMAASLCFYAAGLLDNDLADLREDQAERPSRPLPSGAAKPTAVWVATLGLALAGLAFCAAIDPRMLGLGALLIVTIAAYNHGLKRIPVLGAVTMGGCRGLSLLLGAAAAPSGAISLPSLEAALILGLFIAAVTNLARFETRSTRPGYAAWLPALALLVGLGVCFTWPPMGLGPSLGICQAASKLLMGWAILLGLLIARRVGKGTLPLPPAIGQFIRLLLPLQAAFCVHTGLFGLIGAGLILAVWPLSRFAARRFYAS